VSERLPSAHFDLLIEPARQGQGEGSGGGTDERRPSRLYRARLIRSPAGEGDTEFELPWSARELEAWLGRLSGGRSLTPLLEDEVPGPDDRDPARTVGTTLFQAVFSGEVGSRFEVSLENCRKQGRALVVRLRFAGDPDLPRLPWEYLYDPRRRLHLAVSTETPILRYPELPEPSAPLRAPPPIRILAVTASPRGLASLAVKEEWREIEAALEPLIASGRIVLDHLEHATVRALAHHLRHQPFHVLHFVGHGEHNPSTGESVIILETEGGQPDPLPGSRLGALLHEGTLNLYPPAAERVGLKLVVLNACEAAYEPGTELLDSVARGLIHQGIPAVMAMQFPISDRAARRLSAQFYSALAAGEAVEGALTEARNALFVEGYGTEWGTPVLYLRSDDGHLFEEAPSSVAPFLPLAALPETPGGPSRAAVPPGRSPPFSRRLGGWIAAFLLTTGVAWGLWTVLEPGPVLRSDPRCPPHADLPGLAFAYIEAGTFRMGSEDGNKDERPTRQVHIAHPFCIGKTEVTVGQWEAVMGKGEEGERGRERELDSANLPKNGTSWEEAWRFTEELTERGGGEIYRLPTDAEWEYAARAGTETAYSFGDDPEDLPRYGNCLGDQSASGVFEKRAPVASFKPNPWGLFDVHGNVWEWVADAADGGRIRRGGGYENKAENCRSTQWFVSRPDWRVATAGLRLVLEVPSPASADASPG